MERILLDTNFLMIPASLGVDIYEQLREYNIFTLDICLHELEKLAHKRGKTAKNARLALILVQQQDLKTVAFKGKSIDKAIRDYAIANECGVATNDKKLITSLQKNGIKVFRLRQRKIIE